MTDRTAAGRWLAARTTEGARERTLEDLPPSPWDLADRGWATTAEPVDVDGIAAGLSAVLRGVAVAFVVPADPTVAELLADELGRALRIADADGHSTVTGEVLTASLQDPSATEGTHRAAPAPRPGPAAVELDPETLELLAVLAGGASTAEAAAAVHVSLRTAERRLTAARRALGVRSTAELVRAVMGAGT
ncbi:MAG: hypothetical protein ACYC2O_11850 [Microthrixaceae bacterium]